MTANFPQKGTSPLSLIHNFRRYLAPLKRAVLLLSDLVSLGVLGVIAWYGWTTVQRQMGMSTVSLGMPISVFILPVALSATVMIVHTLVLMGHRLSGRPVHSSFAPDPTLQR